MGYKLTHLFFAVAFGAYTYNILLHECMFKHYSAHRNIDFNYILTRIYWSKSISFGGSLFFVTVNWVSVFEFNGYSVQRSVRSAMFSLNLNKPHNYKLYFEKKLNSFIKFSVVFPNKGLNLIQRFFLEFLHFPITNVLQDLQQQSSHQRHPSSGKPSQIKHPLLSHPFL